MIIQLTWPFNLSTQFLLFLFNRLAMLPRSTKSFEDLSQLCSVHSEIELFVWLTNKLEGTLVTGNAVERQSANYVKENVISSINECKI